MLWPPAQELGICVVGPCEVWFQDPEVEGDLARNEIHLLFARSGEVLLSYTELRFRTRAELSRSLSDAGFSVESVFGDWDGRPADGASRDLIFVAASWAKFAEPPFFHEVGSWGARSVPPALY